MEDRKQTILFYSSKLDEIVRAGKDINFEDVSQKLELIFYFYENFYEKKQYQATFNDGEKAEINDRYFELLTQTVQSIIDKRDWKVTSSDSYQQIETWKQRIKDIYAHIVANGYVTRIQAAVGADPDRLKIANEKLLGQQEQLLTEQSAKFKTLSSQQEKLLDSINHSKAEADVLLKNVKSSERKAAKSLAKQIESSYGNEFKIRSDSYKKAADKWLGALLIFGIIYSSFAGWVLFELLNKNISDINGISAAFKIAALLGGLYLVSILNRNYTSNKHLQVVNLHRASIFSIINELVKAQDDDVNKEFLLTYGAKTIFDMGETGYLTRNYGAGTEDNTGVGFLLEKISKTKNN